MRLLGKNIAVFVNEGGKYKPIGLSTSCTLDINTDMIEMASSSARAKAYTPGRYSYTVQIDRLVDVEYSKEGDTNKLLRYELNNTPMTIVVGEVTLIDGEMVPSDYTQNRVVGEAFISNQSLSGSVAGHATHRVSLQGTGELNLGSEAIDLNLRDAAAEATGDLNLGDANDRTDTYINLNNL